MIQLIIDNFITIAGGILTIAFGWYVTYRIYRKNRVAEASVKFRNKILTELKGLYPVTQCWEQSIFLRFRQSIPEIESITTEFRYFVPFYRKWAYNKALKDYCKYCNEITWNNIASYSFWPNFPKPRKNPREQFKNIVEHLLSFANKD
ncbi:MAG: hypothetical protein AB1610_08315 [Nitrospirota bacterium]